ncbi:MAG: DUF1624 domain-containing protein [Acidobacteriaceae bacterium]
MSDVATAMQTEHARSAEAPTARILSVDFMRGLVMIIMAIDHSRDFLTNIPFEPEDITHTFPALFFTRWITHFCAPMFFFLAGTGAYLLRRKTDSVSAASRFLWTRGLWLVLLEFTIIEYAWTFTVWQMGGIIWSIGCCMVLLALLIRLPDQVTLAVGLTLILFHNLFDPVAPAQFGKFSGVWMILHRKGVIPHTHFFVLFPWIPLLGVMAIGYVFGKLFDQSAQERQRMMLLLGGIATATFLVLRGFNLYGNPVAGVAGSSLGPWQPQSTLAMSVVSFLDLEKYPPSLQFLLMILGPSLILFSVVDRLSPSKRFERWAKPIVVFGRVPLFFYILHLYAIHFAAILLAKLTHQPVGWLWKGSFWMNEVPAGYGHGLPAVYLTWFAVVVLLYFPCAWFAEYKRRHRAWWWLSYL